ncbi:hypothetical protein D3C80_1109990 [compost metagenome]
MDLCSVSRIKPEIETTVPIGQSRSTRQNCFVRIVALEKHELHFIRRKEFYDDIAKAVARIIVVNIGGMRTATANSVVRIKAGIQRQTQNVIRNLHGFAHIDTRTRRVLAVHGIGPRIVRTRRSVANNYKLITANRIEIKRQS